jgi:NADPH-dependent ferric siderophore reductase
MSPIPSFVTKAVERLLFKSVVVSEVRNIGPRFRLVHLEGKGFEGVKWVPGQTAQFHLGNLMARAYTPMDLDSKNGSARFLFYLHGGGPGSTWASSLKIGDGCLVMRPKDSLDFASFDGPAIFSAMRHPSPQLRPSITTTMIGKTFTMYSKCPPQPT